MGFLMGRMNPQQQQRFMPLFQGFQQNVFDPFMARAEQRHPGFADSGLGHMFSQWATQPPPAAPAPPAAIVPPAAAAPSQTTQLPTARQHRLIP